MRIGVFTGDVVGRGAPRQIRTEAAQAAEDGLASFWQPNIFGVDGLTMTALLADDAPGVELGVAVVPTYPRHPLALAQQAMTTQVATGGRLALGVGPSHQMVIEAMFGLSYEKPVRHIREYLTALTSLVRTGSVSFAGETVSANGTISIEGCTPFPILLAALGSQMLKVAGALADGTVTWMCGLDTVRSHIAPGITAATEAAGRDTAPRVVVGCPVCVTTDPEAARAKAADVLAMYGMLPAYRAMLDREGAAGPGEIAVVGGADEVAEQISAFGDAGATEFVAVIFSDDGDEQAATRAALRTLVD